MVDSARPKCAGPQMHQEVCICNGRSFQQPGRGMTILRPPFERNLPIPSEDITVLIPEARLHKRYRRLRIGMIALVSAGVLCFSAYVGSMRGSTTLHSGARTDSSGSTAILPVGTVINASTVTAIEMFSSNRGVAISTFWNKNFAKIEHSYVTTTTNGGKTWRISGVLPDRSWTPPYSGNSEFVFISPQEGYIAQTNPSDFLFTANGGRTWSKVAYSGLPTAMWLSNKTVVASFEICPAGWMGTDRCLTSLGAIRMGSLTVTGERQIPSLAANSIKVSEPIVGWSGSAGLAQDNTVLLATSNDGETWRSVTSPCPGGSGGTAQIVSNSRWVMLCGRGVGMMDSYLWLYKTNDSGRTWSLLAEASPSPAGPTKGNLGPFALNAFSVSSDGQLMWMDGGPGFIQQSTDGGLHWRTIGNGIIPGANDNITGPGFVSVGHEVWIPIVFGGLVRATTPISWRVLGESSFATSG